MRIESREWTPEEERILYSIEALLAGAARNENLEGLPTRQPCGAIVLMHVTFDDTAN
jgi:hypothetical protein